MNLPLNVAMFIGPYWPPAISTSNSTKVLWLFIPVVDVSRQPGVDVG